MPGPAANAAAIAQPSLHQDGDPPDYAQIAHVAQGVQAQEQHEVKLLKALEAILRTYVQLESVIGGSHDFSRFKNSCFADWGELRKKITIRRAAVQAHIQALKHARWMFDMGHDTTRWRGVYMEMAGPSLSNFSLRLWLVVTNRVAEAWRDYRISPECVDPKVILMNQARLLGRAAHDYIPDLAPSSLYSYDDVVSEPWCRYPYTGVGVVGEGYGNPG